MRWPRSPLPTQVPLPRVPLATEAPAPQASPSLQGLSPHPVSFLPLFLRGICSQMAQARPSPETLHPDSEPALPWAALLSTLVTGRGPAHALSFEAIGAHTRPHQE